MIDPLPDGGPFSFVDLVDGPRAEVAQLVGLGALDGVVVEAVCSGGSCPQVQMTRGTT